MNNHKRQYKAGPKDNSTLTDRVKVHRERRQTSRFNKFDSRRNIQLDESPTVPAPPKLAISKIADRNQKLKAYRLAKNELKLKEVMESRPPFIAAVPVGRWVQKEENIRPYKVDTPIKQALLNERILKKSTVKTLIAKSSKKTIEKQDTAQSNKKQEADRVFKFQPNRTNAKKQILGQFNEVAKPSTIVTEKQDSHDLDTTFEILPDDEENRPCSSNSVSVVKKEPMKATTKPKACNISKVQSKPKPSASSVAPPAQKLTRKRLNLPSTTSPKEVAQEVVEVSEPAIRSETQPSSLKSETYRLKMSHVKVYRQLIASKLSIIDKESTYELLSDEEQVFVRKTIQQAILLQHDRMNNFCEFLEQFEDNLAGRTAGKVITEDDVEFYWEKIFEELNALRADIDKVEAMNQRAQSIIGSQKKRRTRRTFVPPGGTPKRSIRLAENAGTPKHDASCFGCVNLSATRVNTPKSASKRRTTLKQNFTNAETSETPKRSGRRSSKRTADTPKRLLRMNAIDDHDTDEELF